MGLKHFNFVFIFISLQNSQETLIGDKNASVADIIVRRTNEYLELCPYTDTCTTNKSIPEEFLPGQHKPCCYPCKCDKDCGRNCCPDKSATFERKEDMYIAKEMYRCVDAQLRPNDVRIVNGQSFKMIIKCPFRYNNKEIAAKCAREYIGVEFDGPLRYILPVYDKSADSIYKNIFCASCHKVDLDQLDFARLNFKCNSGTRNITYIRDFARIPEVIDNDDCNLLFEIPNNIRGLFWGLKMCNRNFIDRCNVTGKWKSYDSHLEEACLSYKSIYANFRNVHCYLCNGFNKSNVNRKCEVLHYGAGVVLTIDRTFNFITLLDWNKNDETVLLGKATQETEKDEQCFQNNIYDPSKRDEWFLQCPYGMWMIYGMCFPPIKSTPSAVMMELNLNLIPDEGLLKQNRLPFDTIISIILDEIQLKLELLISRETMLHRMYGTVKFKTDFGDVNSKDYKINVRSVRYIRVQIHIRVTNLEQTLLGTIIDFALGLTNISGIGNFFSSTFYHFDATFFDQWQLKSNCIEIKRHRFRRCFKPSLQSDKEVYFEILPIGQKMYSHESFFVISVEPEPFCPRVALPKLFSSNCNKSESMSNIYEKKILSKRLSENETHMFFCHEDFFQHLNSLQKKFVGNPEKSVKVLGLTYLTIVCLGISLLSLVSTLITYSVYPTLRSLPGLNNMALVLSLIIFQTMSLLSTITRITVSWLCSIFGTAMHLSLTLSFAWMFVVTFHMLKVFVRIRNRSVARNDFQTFINYNVFTLVISLSVVSITILVGAIKSNGDDIGYGGANCYIKDPSLIIFFVALPVGMVIITNIFMFSMVVYKIHKQPILATSNSQERHNISIFVKLSTITGMTWIFGFIYVFTQHEAFAYIFVILNAGQGVFIMLSFVCNRKVINLIFKKKRTKESKRQTKSTQL